MLSKYFYDKTAKILSSWFEDITVTLTDGDITISNNYVVTFGTQSYWKRTILDCSVGDQFKITLTRTSNASVHYHAIFTNDTNQVLATHIDYSASGNITDYEATAPEGATKLYIQSFTTGKYMFVKKKAKLPANTVANLHNKVTNIQDILGGDFETQVVAISNGDIDLYNNKFLRFNSQSYWKHATITCVAGDVFRISLMRTANASVHYHVLFCDATGEVLAQHLDYSSGGVSASDDYEVVAPVNTTTLYIQSFTEGSYLYVKKKVSVKTKMLNINDRMSSIEGLTVVPSYYTSHIASKIAEIKAITQGITNGDYFAFFTDLHIGANSLSSFSLLKEILKKTSVTKVVCGGDFCTAYGTDDYCKTVGYVYNDAIADIAPYGKVYTVRGNHDFSVKESESSSDGYTATRAFNYDLIMRNQADYVNGVAGKLYYYVDNPTQKIRYIFLDTSEKEVPGDTQPWGVYYGIVQAQLDWFISALNVSAGWSVMVIGHISCVTEITDYSSTIDVIAGLLKALKNKRTYTYTNAGLSLSCSVDYTTKDTEVIGYLCGHNHKDMSATVDNTLFISTTCDSRYQDDGIARTAGTTAESAIDVVCINTTAKTLNLIRVGAGSNRNFTY